MVQWADTHLPAGTPILCDRYFTAWNEFPANHPTNVVFMSTVPNQLTEQYTQNQWREKTIHFFRQHPDAAFFEQKMHWKTLGPWKWPRDNFARKITFTDEETLKLKALGISYHREKNLSREPHERTLYYNTREDQVEQRKQAGEKTFGIWGRHWKYVKTQDLRDWRMMQKETTLDLYNLTESPVSVNLTIKGTAVGGSKWLLAGADASPAFHPREIRTWTLSGLTLPPGMTELLLKDPLWEKQKIPLLVEAINVHLSPASP